MSAALDQEFETGVRLIRDAYSKKLEQKESEVVQLRGENARQSAEIQDLSAKVQTLEQQLSKADRRIQDLTKTATKLQLFKQTIFHSFADTNTDNSGSSTNQQGYHGAAAAAAGDASLYLQPQPIPNHSATPDLYTIQQQQQQPQHPLVNPYQQAASFQTQNNNNNNNNPYLAQFLRREQEEDASARYGRRPSRNAAVDRSMGNLNELALGSISSQLHLEPSATKGSANGNGVSATAPTPYGAGSMADLSTPNNVHPSHKNHPMNTPGTPKQQPQPQPQHHAQQHQAEVTVDGRGFFRKAKSILSYDDFTNLLWNVKAYNARDQTRVRTLEQVFDRIGGKYPQVFAEFEQLLQR